jgi:hypothetical protein
MNKITNKELLRQAVNNDFLYDHLNLTKTQRNSKNFI